MAVQAVRYMPGVVVHVAITEHEMQADAPALDHVAPLVQATHVVAAATPALDAAAAVPAAHCAHVSTLEDTDSA